MSNFYVKPSNLKSSAGNMAQVQRAVRLVSSDVQSVINALNKSNGEYASIVRNLRIDRQNLQKTDNTLGTMKTGAEKIASLYRTTEQSLTGNKPKTGAAKKPKKGSAAKSTIWDKFKEQYKHRVEREERIYKKIAKELKFTAGWWVDKYKKYKGTIEKIYKTGKAVATIAGSVACIAALWGLTAGSAGVGTPLATLGTIYAGDAIINSVCDIIDIWGGNPGHAGKNHALQDAMKEGGSQLGEMIGNKKLGETIGNGIYYTGKVLSISATIEAVAGKVVQAPDLKSEIAQGVGEIKSGFNGVIDIVTKSPLSQVKYDLALLKYEVPHIVKVVECSNIIGEVYKTSKKVIDSGVSLITDTIDCYSAAVAAH